MYNVERVGELQGSIWCNLKLEPLNLKPKPMNNRQISRRFNRMASLMEIRGEDTFRIRSYRMAAEAIETWPMQMKEIAKKEGAAGLGEIPGGGQATAGKILELIAR